MKNKILLSIISFLIGGLVFGGIGLVIATTYRASDITYTPTDNTWNVSNVQGAINDLSVTTYKKVCELKEGENLAIGSKYECDPGDGIKRIFYVLEMRRNEVDLIMDRNITQGTSTKTMSWYDAMKYFKTGGGTTYTTNWTNVLNIDLPKAQAIVKAVRTDNWQAANNGATWWCLATGVQDLQSPPYCNANSAKTYNWLYNYLKNCNGCTNSLGEGEAYGYWTRDLIASNNYAWSVYSEGRFAHSYGLSDTTFGGVRPVITILKTNLY